MDIRDIIWLFINPFEAIRTMRDFLEMGGSVLVAIMVATLVLWVLIYERYSFFRTGQRQLTASFIEAWAARREHKSWYAHKIRLAFISAARCAANRNLIYIKTLVALAPFLGLLGTVTGMVEVFDVMAVTGSGNARAMAAGIAKATLPTMAGMVTALSGLFFITSLERRADFWVKGLSDRLTLED